MTTRGEGESCPTNEYDPGTPSGYCDGDGHYLCKECKNYDMPEIKQIDINDIRLLPSSMGFGFCVYGKDLSQETYDWAKSWGFRIVSPKIDEKYTNILVPYHFELSKCFKPFVPYHYVDGFSPNLNKNMHVGHLSNFIIAKSLQGLGIGNKFISILGDTLEGSVSQAEAMYNFVSYCETFDYVVDDIYYASKALYSGDKLVDGEGDYLNTKVFDTGEEKIVGIKSDGSTSYFYQDMALAESLGKSTLYLTGNEQDNHFNTLSKFYDHTDHIGLGLVKVKGAKMSSRNGDVIYMNDIIKMLTTEFGGDMNLAYNVLAGFILKNDLKSEKNINIDLIKNAKNSPGLYLSYTYARIKKCGITLVSRDKFNSNKLQFALMKAKRNIKPNILFKELIDHCKMMNKLYASNKIDGSPENHTMFTNLLEDLSLGLKLLGMFEVEKV